MRGLIFGGVALMALAGIAQAGSVAEFEAALREAYGNYRAALFMTNSGKQENSAKAVGAFASKWAAIESTWSTNPPPQYADDPKWGETLAAVDGVTAKAAAEITDGKLSDAHQTLEAIRDTIGDLHMRNGITTFSDRMNAYHAAMEHALGVKLGNADAATLDRAHEQAAVLAYLADQMLDHPPQEAAGSEEFGTLSKAVAASVSGYLEAVRSRDPVNIKAAAAKLKPAYAKLFLKFG